MVMDTKAQASRLQGVAPPGTFSFIPASVGLRCFSLFPRLFFMELWLETSIDAATDIMEIIVHIVTRATDEEIIASTGTIAAMVLAQNSWLRGTGC